MNAHTRLSTTAHSHEMSQAFQGCAPYTLKPHRSAEILFVRTFFQQFTNGWCGRKVWKSVESHLDPSPTERYTAMIHSAVESNDAFQEHRYRAGRGQLDGVDVCLRSWSSGPVRRHSAASGRRLHRDVSGGSRGGSWQRVPAFQARTWRASDGDSSRRPPPGRAHRERRNGSRGDRTARGSAR